MTESISESENPAIPSPTPTVPSPRTNQDWWPNQLNLSVSPPALAPADPMGEGFDYAEEFKTLDFDALAKDVDALMTQLAGLVARRLRPLRAALHPHDAGTPQARTASPTAAAAAGPARSASRRSTAGPTTSTSTRRAGCSGRSSRSTAGRSPGPTCIIFTGNRALETMGFKTFGFGGGREDIWAPAGGRLLGPGDHVARRRALQRRSRARQPARRRADGPHLRQPGGPERQPGPAGRRPGHPRDVRPHGHERRGDGRAHRRRPHVRQDPRRGPARQARRSRARGRHHRGAGPRLEEQLRQRQGRRHHQQRAGGRVDDEPHPSGTTTTSRTSSSTSGS